MKGEAKKGYFGKANLIFLAFFTILRRCCNGENLKCTPNQTTQTLPQGAGLFLSHFSLHFLPIYNTYGVRNCLHLCRQARYIGRKLSTEKRFCAVRRIASARHWEIPSFVEQRPKKRPIRHFAIL
jgi:hypothetical protein